ncbi:MAG TPA: type II CAAX endopeptidase family protein [Chthoniobacterales bacterium]|nr:type II CAAX endopeptidase family protein [Chthoniobacterales bacterium]
MFAGAFSSALGNIFVALLVLAGLAVYLTLIRQINARRDALPVDEATVTRPFGLAELFVAIALILLFSYMIAAAVSQPVPQMTTFVIVANELLFIAIVLLVMAYLKLRGFSLDELGGFSKISLKRAVSTGVILLLAGWPLIAVGEVITQKVFGGLPSKQEIVDFFSNSDTLTQRVIVIVLAVVAAPIFEELIFRFFIYGVLRRYFGITVGLIANSFLFAAAHTHLPSALPLFVLAGCFTLAYEWSGSILVSMAMHSLFNGTQLIVLAFPELVQQ